MNRIIIALLAVVFICVGCEDASVDAAVENAITKSELVGVWVIKMTDGVEKETNSYFACRYNADDTEDYLSRGETEDGSSLYTLKEGVSYVVKDGAIYLVSESDDIHIEGTISQGELLGESGDILSYREIKVVEGGYDLSNLSSYKGIRSEVDYSSDIIGLWQGVVSSDSEVAVPYDTIRCEYLRTGVFRFYTAGEGDEWIEDTSNNGLYYTMGNLLATEWTESDGTTSAEGWEIEIVGETMTWSATRSGGAQCGFDFVRL
ncbi:MAG: hypothetical protein R3Y61_06475 [Rikenellaceae bacterium]